MNLGHVAWSSHFWRSSPQYCLLLTVTKCRGIWTYQRHMTWSASNSWVTLWYMPISAPTTPNASLCPQPPLSLHCRACLSSKPPRVKSQWTTVQWLTWLAICTIMTTAVLVTSVTGLGVPVTFFIRRIHILHHLHQWVENVCTCNYCAVMTWLTRIIFLVSEIELDTVGQIISGLVYTSVHGNCVQHS